MIQNMYSVYDKVPEVFNKPFVDLNDASAKRSFFTHLQESKNPTDYELYYVGQFNDATGEIQHRETKRIATGFDNKQIDVPDQASETIQKHAI